MSKFAVDTNLILYLHDLDFTSNKCVIASSIMADIPHVSAQVISEYLNVCNKRFKLDKEQCLKAMQNWLSISVLIPNSEQIYNQSLQLIKKYQFQLFDSIIVASALEAGCTILYSEDMHHDLLVENQLRIINPFV